jgi:hypothetical protein
MDQRWVIRIDSSLRLPRSGLVQQLFIQKVIFQVLFNFCLNPFEVFLISHPSCYSNWKFRELVASHNKVYSHFESKETLIFIKRIRFVISFFEYANGLNWYSLHIQAIKE